MRSFVALALLLATSAFAAPAVLENPGHALLQFAENEQPRWVALEEKYALEEEHVKFVDVTATWADRAERLSKVAQGKVAAAPLLATFPAIAQQDTVAALIANLSTANLQSQLATLTAFNNRHYRSSTGEAAAVSIFDTAAAIASAAGRADVAVSQFTHANFAQRSVIAKIAGSEPDAPVVVLGAHLDSISGGTSARAPGADDDGSGSVTLLEAYRALLQGGYAPRAPLEFHWYAGEEGGLLGSGQVAAAYARAGTPVRAMVQFDMTAYTQPGKTPAVTFVTDYTDAALTTYLASLVDEYLSIGYATSRCGYGCSDHASWNSNGYPSAFPFEAAFDSDNPRIHSSGDTVDVPGFSFEQILEFTKLAVAASVELTV
ncbi:Zn-dependent exopeptidase [Auricularia subglabra TFB-10046 SS5]|nr:Zn-dependent exopeptidase [Auricularia subglabra TFB-10046 SS5]